MSFVFYDLETTGLRKRYDQITSFAGILTDNDLNTIDRFELRARVCPHIVPSPGAVHVTGVGVDQLFDPALPSQFEAVVAIHNKMTSWSPALFAGFNSVSFDEEMLRHAFYQNLKYAYVTSRRPSARADILGLCRVTAAQRPDVLLPALGPEGRKSFKLAELAAANGLAPAGAHSAMVDVMTTLSLCRHIKAHAPELWSDFARFATKQAVQDFVDAEDGFLYFSARPGPDDPQILTKLGPNLRNPAKVHCLDLLADLDALEALDDLTLTASLATRGGPLVTLRTNTAPIMTPLFEGSATHLGGLSEDVLVARAVRIRSTPMLGPRILASAQQLEPVYEHPRHVEDQLYGFNFPSYRDEDRMREFHAADWQRRAALIREFEDGRLQQLARRIVYFQDPALLVHSEAMAMSRGMADRQLSSGEVPWLTIERAKNDLDRLAFELMARGEAEHHAVTGLREYLLILEAHLRTTIQSVAAQAAAS